MVTLMPQGGVRKRFMFGSNPDDELDQEAASVVVEPSEPMMAVSEHERLLKAAEEAAFIRGELQAKQAMLEQEQAEVRNELQALGDKLELAITTFDDQIQAQERNLVSMCFLIARRMCGHLIAREPLAEVVALLSECLAPLRKVPQILIEVPASDASLLEEMLEKLVMSNSFEGRIHVVKSESMSRGDCRIEWPEGGIVRDQRQIIEHIETAIQSHFKARERAA